LKALFFSRAGCAAVALKALLRSAFGRRQGRPEEKKRRRRYVVFDFLRRRLSTAQKPRNAFFFFFYAVKTSKACPLLVFTA